MNIFNDPDDYKAVDAIMAELLKMENGEVASIEDLFEAAAPGWNPKDVDLSSIDREVRRKAAAAKISLLSLPRYRDVPGAKAYEVPFRVYRSPK